MVNFYYCSECSYWMMGGLLNCGSTSTCIQRKLYASPTRRRRAVWVAAVLQDLQVEALANRDSLRVLEILKNGGICYYASGHWKANMTIWVRVQAEVEVGQAVEGVHLRWKYPFCVFYSRSLAMVCRYCDLSSGLQLKLRTFAKIDIQFKHPPEYS